VCCVCLFYGRVHSDLLYMVLYVQDNRRSKNEANNMRSCFVVLVGLCMLWDG
jgi:hypothetical protein